MYAGRVRALLDERGKGVKEAGPAIPVQVLGVEKVPTAGDVLVVVEDATNARETAQKRERLDREARNRRTSRARRHPRRLHGAGRSRRAAHAAHRHQGGPGRTGRGAGRRARHSSSTSEVEVQVIHRGVGAVTRERHSPRQGVGRDHRRIPRAARQQRAGRGGARRRRDQTVPHHLTRRSPMCALRSKGCCGPEQREVVDGEAVVRELFKVARVGTIAGCFVAVGPHQPRRARPRHSRRRAGVRWANRLAATLQRGRARGPRRASSAASESRTSTT